jgi:short-subunit dehydrogenase
MNNEETKKRYAVVTGASRGLGRKIAAELARRGYPTLLVSSTDAVHTVREEITKHYSVDCLSFIVDLSDENAVREWESGAIPKELARLIVARCNSEIARIAEGVT